MGSTMYNPIRNLLNEDKDKITYRPKFAKLTGSATSAILLQQMMYWWDRNDRQPFYKFKEPCSHKAYKVNDSWCEALSFNRSEFDLAIAKIGTKITEGKSKASALAWQLPNPNDFPDADSYDSAFNVALEHLVVYWTDSNRLTWYHLNDPLIDTVIFVLYSLKQIPALPRKIGNQLYLDKADSSFTFITETTTETTNRDQVSAQGATHNPNDFNPDFEEDSENPKRKSSAKKKRGTDTPPPGEGVLNAICKLCYGTLDAWSTNASSIRGCYNKLAKIDPADPITIEQLRRFYTWWKQNDWRGKRGDKPAPHQVIQNWPIAMADSTNADRELLGHDHDKGDRYDESAWK